MKSSKSSEPQRRTTKAVFSTQSAPGKMAAGISSEHAVPRHAPEPIRDLIKRLKHAPAAPQQADMFARAEQNAQAASDSFENSKAQRNFVKRQAEERKWIQKMLRDNPLPPAGKTAKPPAEAHNARPSGESQASAGAAGPAASPASQPASGRSRPKGQK